MNDPILQEEDTGYFGNESATFGDRVTAAREAVGITDQMLAKRLGVKLKTVRNWEDDLSEPRANKLQMLAGLLNVSLMWLLMGEGDGLDAPETPEPLSDDVEAVLLDLRKTRTELVGLADRMAVLDKRLGKLLRQPS